VNDLTELHGREGDFASVIFFSLFSFLLCFAGVMNSRKEEWFLPLFVWRIAHNPDSEQRLLPS